VIVNSLQICPQTVDAVALAMEYPMFLDAKKPFVHISGLFFQTVVADPVQYGFLTPYLQGFSSATRVF
jgi:hypothetical protein